VNPRALLYALGVTAGAVLVLLVSRCGSSTPGSAYDQTVCAGPPLRGAEAREDAMEKGYAINSRYGCIDKASFDEVNRQAVAAQQARQLRQAQQAEQARVDAAQAQMTLAQARRGFQTTVAAATQGGRPLPQPPAELFVRTDYASTGNLVLPAFITPSPKDGRKHPAIIWLTGGDTNSLDDFWTPGPESNDQSASAFRKAGIVMMFPTLRGGNQNPGAKEYFLGEVDDVLAAAEHLARQPYVDPARIYLGGHSTGGTLALLTAQTSGRFGAVFAFGPVADASLYGRSLIPAELGPASGLERKLRAPIHWLHGITSPTYVIEGRGGNIEDLERLCAKAGNPLLRCIPVEGADHFSVLSRVLRPVAARIAVSPSASAFSLAAEEFQK
jgi:acetyl esterase/lipase